MIPARIEIDLIQDEALAVLRVRGDLDLATVPTLRHVVRQKRSECEVVVVDLRTLDFIDSSAWGSCSKSMRSATWLAWPSPCPPAGMSARSSTSPAYGRCSMR